MISEINLVSNQHLAVEMFLIRLMYLKKSFLMKLRHKKFKIKLVNEKMKKLIKIIKKK